MKKNNNVFLMLLAIATLLTAVVGATYAYFASVTDGTGVSTDLDVEAQANTAQFTAEGGTFGFTVTGADMMQANAGSLAKESTGSLEVSLTSPKLALCTFDVKFGWNEGSSYTPTATLADGVTEFGVLYEGNSYGAVNNAAKVINFDKLLNNHNGVVLDQAKIAILESDGTEKTETINLNFKVQMYNLNHDQSALAGTASKTYNGKFYIDNVECTETKLPLNDVILASNEIYPDNIASPYVTNETGIDFGQVSSDTNGKGVYYTNDNTENNDYTFYFRGDVENNYVKLGTESIIAGDKQCLYNNEPVLFVENQPEINPDTGEIQDWFLFSESDEDYCSEYGSMVWEYQDPVIYYNNDGEYIEYKYTIGYESYEHAGIYIDGAKAEWKQLEKEVDVLWKIIRINEDNSIRLIKSLNPAVSEGSSLYDVSFGNGGVGGVFTQPLGLKEYYINNLKQYENLLADSGFCHDYSTYDAPLPESAIDAWWTAAYNRIDILKKPQFKCPSRSYLLTVSGGSYEFEYPIGMLSVDEVAYAGSARTGTSSDFYLHPNKFTGTKNNYFFTITDQYYDAGPESADKYIVNSSGLIGVESVSGKVEYIYPVINLQSTVKISSGDGTESNPYQLILE